MDARSGVNFRAFSRFATALLAGGFAATGALASDVPLTLTDRGFPIVEVAINGAGPFPMVLDTAAGITTVTTPVKDELGLANIGRMPQPVQLAGGPQAVDLYVMGQVTLGGRSAPAPITIVLDAPMKYVREARGILGMNVLSHFSLDIDQPGKRIVLYEPGALPASGSDWSMLPVAKRWDHFLVVDAVVNGIAVKAVIDTGANETILNGKLRDALGIVEGGPGVTAGNLALTDTQSLKATIGPITLDRTTWDTLKVQAADLPLFKALGVSEAPGMILGNDALKQVRLFVDYAGDKIYLTRPAAPALIGSEAP
ncbi:MAG: retroviral-like aspartic protease family protein [Alphaproteobacteria bacterium]|nr:retroviral-like aspartic protease family protein [Alphaproteobacteria bacterium]